MLANALDQLKMYQLTLRLREQARSHFLPCPLCIPLLLDLSLRLAGIEAWCFFHHQLDSLQHPANSEHHVARIAVYLKSQMACQRLNRFKILRGLTLRADAVGTSRRLLQLPEKVADGVAASLLEIWNFRCPANQ